MIIFDKFGDGQSERNRSVPVCPGNPMRAVTLRAWIALTKERTREGVLSQIGEGLSRPSFAAQSAGLVRDQIPAWFRAPRVAGCVLRMPLSNRELDLLEPGLSHCKQRKATGSNRELWTGKNPAKIGNSSSFRMIEGLSLPVISDTNVRAPASFLTGSGSQTEFAVTRSKQTTDQFLTGSRIAHFQSAARQLKPQECGSRDMLEQGRIPPNSHKEKEQL